MNRVINPSPLGGGGGGLVPTIRATAPVGSTVSCDGQTKVVGAEGFVDFVVSAEPVNILPDGVQGLDSIESTGGQYINTGIVATSGFRFKSTITPKKADTGWQGICGSHATSSPYKRNFFAFATTSIGSTSYPRVFGVGAGNGDKLSTSFDINKQYEIDVCNEYTNTYLYVDGVLQSLRNGNGTYSSAYSERPLYLFVTNNTDGVKPDTFTGIMGESFIEVSGSESGHFYPAIYNNQVGMWDTVSNAFFGNQGTSSFIAGEPKEWLDYPTYTVTVNGASQMVKVDKVGLFPVLFN